MAHHPAACLQLTVYTGRGATDYNSSSTLLSGEKDMLLIDAQVSLNDAHRLAATILESRKSLTTICITDPDPDHMFGLPVSNVDALANPEALELFRNLPKLAD